MRLYRKCWLGAAFNDRARNRQEQLPSEISAVHRLTRCGVVGSQLGFNGARPNADGFKSIIVPKEETCIPSSVNSTVPSSLGPTNVTKHRHFQPLCHVSALVAELG